MKSTDDLIMLAGTGANLVIDAKTKTTSEIIMIVGSIGLKGSHITIRNANCKTTAELLQITMVYPKNITYDLTVYCEEKK
jgi:hypothetical protein